MNYDVEKQFITSLIIFGSEKSSQLHIVFEKINMDDFFNKEYQELFLAIKNIHEKGRGINILTIHEEMGSKNEIAIKISELTNDEIGIMPLEMARILKKRSLMYCMRQKDSVDNWGKINEMKQSLEDIRVGEKTIKSEEHLLQAMIDRGNPDGESTGFLKLDAYTKKLANSHFWLIGGYSNTGKTGFAMQILDKVHQEARTAFISLEMTGGDLMEKLIHTKKERYKKTMNHEEKELENIATKEIIENPFLLPEHIHTLFGIKKFIKDNKPEIVFIDYVQMIQTNSRDDIYKKMTTIAFALKEIAKENECCIVALSQVNESAQKTNSNATAGFKGSGDLMAASDVAIILKRYFDEEGDQQLVPFDVVLRKNRFGRTGKISMDFDVSNGIIYQNTSFSKKNV